MCTDSVSLALYERVPQRPYEAEDTAHASARVALVWVHSVTRRAMKHDDKYSPGLGSL